MNWFKKIWNNIVTSNDAFFYKQIKDLQKNLKDSKEDMEELTLLYTEKANTLEKTIADYVKLKSEFEKYKENINNPIIPNNNYTTPEFLDTSKHSYFPSWKVYYYKNGMKTELVRFTPSKFYRIFSDDMYQYFTKEIKGIKTFDKKIIKLRDLACNLCRYETDVTSLSKAGENWRIPPETYYGGLGDCVAGYETIYTDKGLIPIKDINIGDKVLSYDFDKQKYKYKPVLNKWYKGELQINRVHFRNGSTIDLSEKHKMIHRTLQKESKYNISYLKDIDLTKWWKRKVPVVIKIPYTIKDIDWLDDDLAFVVGHFLAEGWTGKSKVDTSGYEINDFITPILEKHNIPFTEYNNSNGVPCLRFLKSEFKDFLKSLKNNSFIMPGLNKLSNLPINKLQSILNGLFVGDGHYRIKNYGLKQYSTVSDDLMIFIRDVYYKIGTPVYTYKQLNHQGLGNTPIWRIDVNPHSNFNINYGYNNISEVSIFNIEKLDTTDMYDIEIADTHNFILSNGVITHNCEDSTILWVTACKICGINPERVFNATGYIEQRGKSFGHSFGLAKFDDGKWYVIETTSKRKPVLFKESKYKIPIKSSLNGLTNWEFSGRSKLEQF